MIDDINVDLIVVAAVVVGDGEVPNGKYIKYDWIWTLFLRLSLNKDLFLN